MEYEIYKTAGGKKRVNIGEQIYLLAPYEQGGNAPPPMYVHSQWRVRSPDAGICERLR